MRGRVLGRLKGYGQTYKGFPILDKNVFYKWALSSTSFNRLWKIYVKSGFERMSAPSVDRKETSKGYTLDNIRFLSTYKNSIRGLNSYTDQIKAGRVRSSTYGEDNHFAKLSEEIVLEIRSVRTSSGATYPDIASRFGLTKQHVYNICTRRAWTHI